MSLLLPPGQVALPPEDDEIAPYWESTRESRLLLSWCSTCNLPIWFPRAVCPKCLGETIEWKESTGRGVLYAYSVHHRPAPGRNQQDGHYAVALVELNEGVRLLTNIVGCGEDALEVGLHLELYWYRLPDGRGLPFFTPVTPGVDA